MMGLLSTSLNTSQQETDLLLTCLLLGRWKLTKGRANYIYTPNYTRASLAEVRVSNHKELITFRDLNWFNDLIELQLKFKFKIKCVTNSIL